MLTRDDLLVLCLLPLGRSKQYAPKKQLFVKKGSWQQENWGERKRTRHFPPSKGRQPEVCIATFIQNCIISLLLILVDCAVEKSIA